MNWTTPAFHQQELYDEWEKLAEEQESFDSEGD